MSFSLNLDGNSDFTQALRKAPAILDKIIVKHFKAIGEEVINSSYGERGYGRITGRLQSSYAYAIIRDKKIIYFKERPDESDPATYPPEEADITPRQQMEEGLPNIIAGLPEKGYFLIIIAAMYYGLYVHSSGRMVMIPLENSNELAKTNQILGSLFGKQVKQTGGG